MWCIRISTWRFFNIIECFVVIIFRKINREGLSMLLVSGRSSREHFFFQNFLNSSNNKKATAETRSNLRKRTFQTFSFVVHFLSQSWKVRLLESLLNTSSMIMFHVPPDTNQQRDGHKPHRRPTVAAGLPYTCLSDTRNIVVTVSSLASQHNTSFL